MLRKLDQTLAKYEMVKYVQDNDEDLYSNIKRIYGYCYNILLEIPQTFPNYTIHDINHSIRVIGYMNDLIKDNLEQYSCLHIAIMIFTGLLHDTGMVVSDAEKQELYADFEKKDDSFKNKTEMDKLLYLQEYIRKRHGSRVLKVIEQKVNQSGTKLKEYLSTGETGAYDISGIVGSICQAHTEDTDWLIQNLDDELVYGNYKFNPKHIAVLLRIGDSLDIDDRRAPYIIYNMLKIKGYSEEEWKMHIPVTNYQKISKAADGNTYIIRFEGKCNDYIIYQKINVYINKVETWLQKDIALCKEEYAINIRLPIEKCIRSDEFEETELSFSLNYEQITKLLMGERIYGNKKDGLRELIQNAIDAVLLMKDLESDNRHSTYTPTIGIEINKADNTIAVFDNGVGMSEDILKQYFFNVGNSYYESKEFTNARTSYCPIGHFGIGFLSCFMLSSRITLETKHYTENSELIRMSFDKESYDVIKYKKKKRKNDRLPQGTIIYMDYNQIIPNVFPDEKSIKQYVQELLIENHYQFIFHNSIYSPIKLKKPKLIYKKEKDKEEVEFDYKVAPTYSYSFLNTIDSFFFDKEVFISDNRYRDQYNQAITEPTSITDFIEDVENLNNALQQTKGQKRVLKTINNAIEDSYTDLFVSFTMSHMLDIEEYFNRYGNVEEYYQSYLSSFINNNELIWYEYPLVQDSNRYHLFQEAYEKNPERALMDYAHEIIYLPFICKESKPNPKYIINAASLYYDTLDHNGNENPVAYLDQYPFRPIRRKVKILRKPSNYQFAVLLEQYHDCQLQTYLKGIRVMDDNLTLSYAIKGIDIDSILINFKSSRYRLDVSRTNFLPESREEVIKTIACAVYGDIRKKRKLTKEEKELIDLFLQVYYDKKPE